MMGNYLVNVVLNVVDTKLKILKDTKKLGVGNII